MSRTLRAIALITLLVLSASTIAACGVGGMSKDAYIEEMLEIDKKSDEVESELNSAEMGGDALSDAVEGYDGLVDDIEDLDAPSDVAEQHDELVSVLRDMIGMMRDLEPVLADLDPTDPEAAQAVMDEMESFEKDADEIDERMEDLQKEYEDAGYDELAPFFEGSDEA